MSPEQAAAIMVRLDSQDRMLERLDSRTEAQDKVLEKIDTRVAETNGRVKKLELWQARTEGAHSVFSWVSPSVAGVVSALVIAAILAVIGLL